MAFHKFVNMARTPEEKAEEAERMMGAIPSQPDYPVGLTICLDEVDLEKLDLEDDCEVGDMIHLAILARVTSVSRRQVDGKACCRVELQGEEVAVENEDAEATDRGLED